MGSKLEDSEEQRQQVDDECDDHVRAYVRVLHVGFDNGKYITQEEIFLLLPEKQKGSFCHGPNSPSPSLCHISGWITAADVRGNHEQAYNLGCLNCGSYLFFFSKCSLPSSPL